MMFKLVAFLFLVTAPEQPVHAMTFNQSAFPSEEACKAFLDTDDGKAASGSMKMMGYGQGLLVKFACIEAKDNTI
jgi:hypothetical protein